MEVLLQVPIIDLRAVMRDDASRLPRPAWPVGSVDPDPGRSEFLRHFGALRSTGPEASGQWEGRLQHVDASPSLRLPPDFSQWFRDTLVQLNPRRPWYSQAACRERKYFGSAVSPRGFYQLRFVIRQTALNNPSGGIGILDAFREMPVHLPHRQDSVALSKAGRDLAQHIARSTTRVGMLGSVPKWAVTSGRPLMVLLADTHEFSTPDSDINEIITTGGAKLIYMLREQMDNWIVLTEPATRNRQDFALHLSRLHSERVTFSTLARHLVRGPDYRTRADLDQLKVERALASAASYLNKRHSFGHPQRELVAAIESDLKLHTGEWQALESILATMRPASMRAATEYVENLVNVKGDLVVGDSFKGVKGSTIINRSTVISSLNSLSSEKDRDVFAAAEEIVAALGSNNDEVTASVVEGLLEEMAGKRRGAILESLWSRAKELAPVLASLASAAATMQRLIAGG